MSGFIVSHTSVKGITHGQAVGHDGFPDVLIFQFFAP